jgi:penicillin-binding protein 1A
LAPDGRNLWPRAAEPERVISPETAGAVEDMLWSAVQEGTGRSAAIRDVPVAGKTGTTNEAVDSWFVGWTPELIAGVWVGYDERVPVDRGGGGILAAPLWRDFVEGALRAPARRAELSSPR